MPDKDGAVLPFARQDASGEKGIVGGEGGQTQTSVTREEGSHLFIFLEDVITSKRRVELCSSNAFDTNSACLLFILILPRC